MPCGVSKSPSVNLPETRTKLKLTNIINPPGTWRQPLEVNSKLAHENDRFFERKGFWGKRLVVWIKVINIILTYLELNLNVVKTALQAAFVIKFDWEGKLLCIMPTKGKQLQSAGIPGWVVVQFARVNVQFEKVKFLRQTLLLVQAVYYKL